MNIAPTDFIMKWHKSDFALNTFLTFISSALVNGNSTNTLIKPQNLLEMIKLLNES